MFDGSSAVTPSPICQMPGLTSSRDGYRFGNDDLLFAKRFDRWHGGAGLSRTSSLS